MDFLAQWIQAAPKGDSWKALELQEEAVRQDPATGEAVGHRAWLRGCLGVSEGAVGDPGAFLERRRADREAEGLLAACA